MAEKRAKDRVVLKLAGVAGDLYSDSEGDDFQKPAQGAQPRGEVSAIDQGNKSNRDVKADYNRLLTPLKQCQTMQDLRDWSQLFAEAVRELPENYAESIRGEYGRLKEQFKALVAA